MLSQTLAYLAKRLRVDPADPELPPLKAATLADVLEAAAADAAVLEGLPLHPSLVPPAPSRPLPARRVILARRTQGNVIFLHPPPPPAPGGSAP